MLPALAPERLVAERLWLTWLGERIIRTGVIPHALGPETLSAAGSPWLSQEWLCALIVASFARLQLGAVLGFLAAAVSVVPLVVLIRTLRRRGIGALQVAWAVAYLGFALDSIFQVRGSGRAIYALPLVVALLANMHASAVLVALLPLVCCCSAVFEERRLVPESRRFAWVAGASVVASCCTPFGIGLWHYAVAFGGGSSHRYVSEWAPLWSTGEPLAPREPYRLPVPPDCQRVSCSDFADCDPYLLAGARVLIDGRCDPFPGTIWRDVVRLARLEPGWRTTLRELRMNVVVAPVESDLARKLDVETGWGRSWTDGEHAIFTQ